ncbi:MAG: DNA polymerase-3 subunit chi [Paraglaciecola psychrophila]|jgi:DNA polymerase-3 subunit chi
MTNIDFYILPDEAVQQRYLFACRLVEKAFRLGHHIYIHGDQPQQIEIIDQLLWSYKSSSFIPHSAEQTAGDSQVLLGCGDGENTHNDLLVNLSSTVPEFFSRFKRVSEIVIKDPAVTASTRENYRFYRDRGYPLKSHQLRSTS